MGSSTTNREVTRRAVVVVMVGMVVMTMMGLRPDPGAALDGKD